jgi:hypothetical protein
MYQPLRVQQWAQLGRPMWSVDEKEKSVLWALQHWFLETWNGIFMTGNCWWDETSPNLIQQPKLSVGHIPYLHIVLSLFMCRSKSRHGFSYSCQGCITNFIREIYFKCRLLNLTLNSPFFCELALQPNGILLLFFLALLTHLQPR